MKKPSEKHPTETFLENQNNAEDLEYVVQMIRWLLCPLGLWPLKSSSPHSQLLKWTLIVVSTFLQAFLLVPCCLHMFLIEKDLGIRLKLIGPLSFVLMSNFKYFTVLLKDREISWCLLNIATDWHEISQESSRKVMLNNAKSARVVITVSFLFMFGGGLPYHTILPYARDPIVVGNVSIRLLAYPGYFVFFNPHVSPIYDLVLLIQSACGLVICSLTVGVVGITIVCVMHICSQCDIMSNAIKEFAADFDEKCCGDVVRQHLKSLKFAAKLEELLNEICMVEILGCTFNLCMLGYYLLTEYENSDAIALSIYFMLLSSFLLNIFIFCYIGDLLTKKCESIGEVAYAIDWYQLSASKARNIILIIESTQRRVILTAGKMVALSMRSFSNIVKASATYLNMLRTLLANNY